LRPGDSCLIHAAAGGVGLLLVQMAKQCGARVIGTVSTEEKAALARDAGADEVILYTKQDFETEVKRLTNNQGVNVVYDSVGKTTFERKKGISPIIEISEHLEMQKFEKIQTMKHSDASQEKCQS